MPLDMHRDDTEKLGVDFASRLGVGETISTIDALKFFRRGVDVTSEFGNPAGAIDGTLVVFTPSARAGNERPGGAYLLLVSITTSEGESINKAIDLTIDARGT